MKLNITLTKKQKIIATVFSSLVSIIILLEFLGIYYSYGSNKALMLTIPLQLAVPFLILLSVSKQNVGENIAYAFSFLSIVPMIATLARIKEAEIFNPLGIFLIIVNVAIPCIILFFVFRRDKHSEQMDLYKFLFTYAIHKRGRYIDIPKIKKELHPDKTQGYVHGFIDGVTLSNYFRCMKRGEPSSDEFMECLYSDFDFLYRVHPDELAEKLLELCNDKRNENIDSATLILVAALTHHNKVFDIILSSIRNAMKAEASQD